MNCKTHPNQSATAVYTQEHTLHCQGQVLDNRFIEKCSALGKNIRFLKQDNGWWEKGLLCLHPGITGNPVDEAQSIMRQLREQSGNLFKF